MESRDLHFLPRRAARGHEIPRPAGENAGLRDDAFVELGYVFSVERFPL
jgi:hypothetical protein